MNSEDAIKSFLFCTLALFLEDDLTCLSPCHKKMGRYNNYFINLLKAAIAEYFAVIFNLLRGRPLLSQFPDQRQIRNILNTITKHQIRDIQDQCIQTVPPIPSGSGGYFQAFRKHTFNKIYDHMTAHRNRFLVNLTNRRTEFQFYRYYYSTCFEQPFCPSSGVLSH
jgi:hypothetical protein